MATQDVVEITKKETVEVITDGKTVAAESPLAGMFDLMEKGKTVQEAASLVQQGKTDADVSQRQPPTKVEVLPSEEEQKKLEQTGLAQQLEADQAKKAQTEEKVPEVPAEVKTEASVDVVPEEDLQVLQTDKPKTAKRIQALLERTKKIQESEANTKKELEARDAKLKELEGQLVEAKKVTIDPATAAAIEAQKEELAMLRRQYELDKDPEVKAKFDDRISGAEKPIAEVLTRHGAEALAKIVQEEGGWLAFSRSRRIVPTKDGEKTAAEVADLVLNTLPFADRQTIQAVSMEQISTKRERDRFFEEEKKKANEYFKRREEQAQQGSLQAQKQIEEAKKVIESYTADMTAKNEWLKEKPIPPTATAAERAAIEDDNRHTQQIRKELDKAIGVKDIPGMLEVVTNAVQFHQERRLHAKTQAELKAIRDENAKLKAELDKHKNASRTVTHRPGSLLATNAGAEIKSKKPQSIDEAFDMIAQGKVLVDDGE